MDFEIKIAERWRKSEVLLLGGSAGSFKVILELVKALPAHFGKAVIIVLHRKKNYASDLENLLTQVSRLPVKEIADKTEIEKDTIYLAPPNYHTLIEKNGIFSLDVSDALLHSRPSIDITFESAADAYGNRATAVLLSGANADGAQGMLKLKLSGSLTIVQHPDDAEMPEMPLAAINLNAADQIMTTKEILELLLS